MKTLRFILKKEFLQIFRNKGMLPIIFVMPVIQLLVLSFAATYELKQVRFGLVDFDQSMASRELVSRLQSGGYFKLESAFFSIEKAKKELDNGSVKMILQIPSGLDKKLNEGNSAQVQILIDAVDGSTAGLIQSYMASIISDYNQEQQAGIFIRSSARQQMASINIIPSNWYNPDLDYITYMVPGIIVILVSMIGLFLSGMNVVREYEIGTIEQLNVTPIRKSEFMIGKLLPFWIIGMFDLCIGLALARFGFHIPFLGSLVTILIIAGIYLIVVQGLGLFISTITHTQQQAMFIAWFIMVVFVLMGGLFTPIESMPEWAQQLTMINPVAYFIEIMRMVLLKGAGWMEVYKAVLVLLAMGFGLMVLSINRYKKTS